MPKQSLLFAALLCAGYSLAETELPQSLDKDTKSYTVRDVELVGQTLDVLKQIKPSTFLKGAHLDQPSDALALGGYGCPGPGVLAAGAQGIVNPGPGCQADAPHLCDGMFDGGVKPA